MSNINPINNLEDFENWLTEYEGLAVIDFYADWCGPCKIMLPIYQNLSLDDELSPVKFLKINRDHNDELIEKYKFVIPSIPRFFVVRVKNSDLTILEDLGGTQSKTQLKSKITKYLELKIDISMQSQSENTALQKPKIAIIGSGPAGLTAAIYASRASLETKLYLGSQPGGQLTTTTEIENFPGAWDSETKKGMYGADLMSLIQSQAEHFGTEAIFSEIVQIQYSNKNNFPSFTLIDNENKQDTFDAVIIATGASSKYLGLPNEQNYIGKGYHTCATCDGAWYKDRNVAIVGGGDSAMEDALFLANFANVVYLLNRTDRFKASPIMLERARAHPKIVFLENTHITEIIGINEKVTGVKIQSGIELLTLNKLTGDNLIVSDEFLTLNVAGLFVAIGHTPNTNFLEGKIDMDKIGYLIPQSRLPVSERTSEYDLATNIPGIFVAGDVEDSVFRQAISAAGQGCKAAINCQRWLQETR
jgi:thioredoxin reductase (NADPH)